MTTVTVKELILRRIDDLYFDLVGLSREQFREKLTRIYGPLSDDLLEAAMRAFANIDHSTKGERQ